MNAFFKAQFNYFPIIWMFLATTDLSKNFDITNLNT